MDKREDGQVGALPLRDRASRPAAQAPTGLGDTATIPSAGYYGGVLSERKAISRFLTVMAARATHRWQSLPWWAFRDRARCHWTMVNLVLLAEQIERGDHCGEQAKWLSDIDGGEAIRRGIEGIVHMNAQGIEAATAGETVGLDGNRESPVANGDAPNPEALRD